MNARPQATAGASAIEIPGRLHPVLALLAFLPLMTVILIALGLTVEELPPLALVGLLGAVVVCCVMLSWVALEVMLGGRIEFAEDGLKLQRFLSERVYPWHEIEACKVMPATGTFGDDALVEADERVGVGLFLRNRKDEREHDLDADVVICAGDRIDVQTMMRIANRVEAALVRARAPQPRQPARASQQRDPLRASQQREPGQRQAPASRPRSAAAKVDPVAQFRNRAR